MANHVRHVRDTYERFRMRRVYNRKNLFRSVYAEVRVWHLLFFRDVNDDYRERFENYLADKRTQYGSHFCDWLNLNETPNATLGKTRGVSDG